MQEEIYLEKNNRADKINHVEQKISERKRKRKKKKKGGY